MYSLCDMCQSVAEAKDGARSIYLPGIIEKTNGTQLWWCGACVEDLKEAIEDLKENHNI